MGSVKTKQCLTDVGRIKKGDFLSEVQYYKVTGVNSDLLGRKRVSVENERGLTFDISSSIVEEGIYSANQFAEERKVTKTEMAEIFSHIGDSIFTVVFNKLPQASDISDAISSLNGGKIKSNAEMKAIVKDAFKGEERTLIGYRIGSDYALGRSTVIDIQQDRGTNPDYDGRLRQVDHRTILSLIYKNVKYSLK